MTITLNRVKEIAHRLKKILFFILPLFTLACTDEEIEGPAQPEIPKELPKVFITTPDETNIVSKEEWVKDGNIVILDEYGNVAIDMQADFKGRGNSTWLLPKKPYAIKLESKAEVLSMPEHKRWVLLANWLDRTLLRNDIAFEIARICLPFTPRGVFVELYLNNEHRGNYYLCEQIKIDKNRLNIDKIDETTPEEEMTGGYLIEFDTYSEQEINYFYTKHRNLPVTIKEPDEDIVISSEHPAFVYIQNYINNVEEKFVSGNYEEIEKLIDVESYADWWIVYNLTGNMEAGHPKSCYMYKKRNGKLYAGPAWNFDCATFLPGRKGGLLKSTLWYCYLFEHKEFKAIVKKRWKELRPDLERIPSYIDNKAEYIKSSNEENFAMWPITHDVNKDTTLPFEEAVERLKAAYIERITELEKEISNY